MARYRKIDVRMWGDERVRRLTPPPPCGQSLWVYLLTNANTTNLPGIYRAGEAQLAEELKWPLKAFREAFAEVQREGLAEADWTARVVWIRGAIKYNAPESPNVVKSWGPQWDEVPECAVKSKAYQHFKGFIEGFGEGFAKAFLKACPEPSRKTIANQEQEQEQEQEQDPPIPPAGGYSVEFLEFWLLYPKKTGKGAAWKSWRNEKPYLPNVRQALSWQCTSTDWTKEGGKFVPNPATYVNQRRWEDEPTARPTSKPSTPAAPGLCQFHENPRAINHEAPRPRPDSCTECKHVQALQRRTEPGEPQTTGELLR